MDKLIHLQIITPDALTCDEQVSYAEVPLEDGNYGILPNHAPMLASLSEGLVRYKRGEEEFFVRIDGGALSVEKNEIILLSTRAEILEQR